MGKTTADGLRDLADFLDSISGTIPTLNEEGPDVTFFSFGFGREEATNLALIAKGLRTFDKNYSDSLLTVSRKFGPVNARFVASRSSVCKRVVVGIEEIPEQVIPAKEAQVIPAHTVEKVEWDCTPSLLAPEFASLEPESA